MSNRNTVFLGCHQEEDSLLAFVVISFPSLLPVIASTCRVWDWLWLSRNCPETLSFPVRILSPFRGCALFSTSLVPLFLGNYVAGTVSQTWVHVVWPKSSDTVCLVWRLGLCDLENAQQFWYISFLITAQWDDFLIPIFTAISSIGQPDVPFWEFLFNSISTSLAAPY